MKTLIDDFSFRYPGVQSVEHVYFHAVHSADPQTRQTYLDKACSQLIELFGARRT